MKRIKVAFALLAVVFVAASAFKTNSSIKVDDRVLTLQYFVPVSGGNIQVEGGWQFVSTAPECSSTVLPCAIRVYAESDHNIDDTKFAALKSASSNFVNNGTYSEGQQFLEKPIDE